MNPTGTHDRPQRPAFLRLELEETGVVGEIGSFADDVLTAHAKWDALPQDVKQQLSFDRFMSHRREHSRGSPI